MLPVIYFFPKLSRVSLDVRLQLKRRIVVYLPFLNARNASLHQVHFRHVVDWQFGLSLVHVRPRLMQRVHPGLAVYESEDVIRLPGYDRMQAAEVSEIWLHELKCKYLLNAKRHKYKFYFNRKRA